MKYNDIDPFIPPPTEYPNFSDKEYWIKRYENTMGVYEWYDDYDTISPLFYELNVPKRSNILHVGIGNSEFSEKMYDYGYKKMYNIDFARNVIHYMKNRNKKIRSHMIFETMDALDLEYANNQFDAIFDKAVLDCVLCGVDSESKGKKFMKEIYRVLKPKGYFFLVSNSEPKNRIKFLQNKNIKFDVDVHSITNDEEQVKEYIKNDICTNFMKKTHYIYICQKSEEYIQEDNNINELDSDVKKLSKISDKNNKFNEINLERFFIRKGNEDDDENFDE